MKAENHINGDLPKDYIEFIPKQNVSQDTEGEFATNAVVMDLDELLNHPELAQNRVDDAKDWVDENHL